MPACVSVSFGSESAIGVLCVCLSECKPVCVHSKVSVCAKKKSVCLGLCVCLQVSVYLIIKCSCLNVYK